MDSSDRVLSFHLWKSRYCATTRPIPFNLPTIVLRPSQRPRRSGDVWFVQAKVAALAKAGLFRCMTWAGWFRR